MSNLWGLRSEMRRWLGLAAAGFVLLLSTGCHHDIRFEDIGYSTGGQAHDAGLVATIPPSTLEQVVSIRSFATGIIHSWDARPGEMLRQIADVEFPQMFKYYRMASHYEEPQQGMPRLTAELSVSHYAFSDWHATVVVQARVFRAGRILAFDRSYREEGASQAGKMIGAGAFGMKSAVRQSSFDAYKKVFAKLRDDLAAVLAQASP